MPPHFNSHQIHLRLCNVKVNSHLSKSKCDLQIVWSKHFEISTSRLRFASIVTWRKQVPWLLGKDRDSTEVVDQGVLLCNQA